MSKVLINGNVFTGYAQLKNCAIFINDQGRIGDIFNMERFSQKKFPSDTVVIDAQNNYILPGFIDSHIHGVGGFGTEDNSPESILEMSLKLTEFGVTRFMPTIYTDVKERMLDGIRAIVEAMGKEKGAIIEGINIEGPFISSKRIGGQNAEGRCDVDLDIFYELLEAGQGKVVCMTVAPELKQMRTLALEARKNNVVLLAGHTDATYENILEGMQCGILHSTHFFNAMSRLHHRNPGTVGAILIENHMNAEIICDGVHVHPDLVKLLIKNKPLDNIVMITDALKPTKQRSGKLYANGVEAILGKEGAFVSKADNSLFLGSSLTMLHGLRNMISWGIPLSDAVQMASTNPARIYSMEKVGLLIPEYKADLTVLDDNFQLKALIIEGNLIKDRLG